MAEDPFVVEGCEVMIEVDVVEPPLLDCEPDDDTVVEFDELERLEELELTVVLPVSETEDSLDVLGKVGTGVFAGSANVGGAGHEIVEMRVVVVPVMSHPVFVVEQVVVGHVVKSVSLVDVVEAEHVM
ncbi:hypothetical protein LTR86_005251 [Recurvomyces mirabilis]|nr:hypothetical protein LTR86_005251 [Recurvomyces mirabilis]